MNDTKYDPYKVKSGTIWAIEAVGHASNYVNCVYCLRLIPYKIVQRFITWLMFAILSLYLVHIRALVSLYQTNTDICTHILLNHYYIITILNSKMLQPLKDHLQGV